MRAVSILQVADPSVWVELDAAVASGTWIARQLDPCRAEVSPDFEKRVLPVLRRCGIEVLVRAARRDPADLEAERQELRETIAALPRDWLRVLHSAQRHALEEVVVGLHAWDPLHDAPAVRGLHAAGLIQALPDEGAPYAGRYRLHRDLPPPPELPYDLDEAVMAETEDLSAPKAGPVGLLHDMAALAAALHRLAPKRTLAGGLAKADARRIGQQLGHAGLASDGSFEAHERWARALRALELLGAVSTDPISREVFVDFGLEALLAGSTRDALDRLVHRLADRDLHGVVPAIRAALRQAGTGAVDELIFLELLYEQHRDLLFPVWSRPEGRIYPMVAGEAPRGYDADGWERVEVPLIRGVLNRLEALGVLRRAPGVFAATEDGRIWAGVTDPVASPLWVRSDLELMVPPDAVTPWERYQLERLGRCLARDVVNRYRLERDALARWLSTHELDEALALLRRRCPAVPAGVEETLAQWARSAQRVVLTQGIIIDR